MLCLNLSDVSRISRFCLFLYNLEIAIFTLIGHSRCDAFRLGALIADDVSAQNPYPMKLKFEKVMQPCALLTKKRYVGMSYICVEQSAGEFDAKGIETVRRDACPFVAKVQINIFQNFGRARGCYCIY